MLHAYDVHRVWWLRAQLEQTSTNMAAAAAAACRMRCLRSPQASANYVTKSFLYCRHFCISTKVRQKSKLAHLQQYQRWKVIRKSLSNLFFFFDKNTVDEEEIERLSRTISDWWNPNGDFAALHSMNKLRVPFIKKSLEHRTKDSAPSRPLRGSRILDVGCGGGILSEVGFRYDLCRIIVNLKEKN